MSAVRDSQWCCSEGCSLAICIVELVLQAKCLRSAVTSSTDGYNQGFILTVLIDGKSGWAEECT